jgi:hypothetical protein
VFHEGRKEESYTERVGGKAVSTMDVGQVLKLSVSNKSSSRCKRVSVAANLQSCKHRIVLLEADIFYERS